MQNSFAEADFAAPYLVFLQIPPPFHIFYPYLHLLFHPVIWLGSLRRGHSYGISSHLLSSYIVLQFVTPILHNFFSFIQLSDLAVLEEVIRMVLEIINSCLCSTLAHNPHLVYTLLYKRELFTGFKTHPKFQDIIQNIDTVSDQKMKYCQGCPIFILSLTVRTPVMSAFYCTVCSGVSFEAFKHESLIDA